MKILIIGSGGREHALSWKLAQSPLCKKLYVASGNAGTAQVAENVPLDGEDFEGLGNFVVANGIELVIVGPEVPLVAGIADYFAEKEELKSVKLIAPKKAGAMLEGSKDFAKEFMNQAGIPTASSKTFTQETLNEGLEYIQNHALPVVLKADGLAAGKGVIIAETHQKAKATLREMLEDKKFGQASTKVVIEQYLQGIELSVFVLTDGKDYVILPEAKDYKRIGEGDTGLNTGGMGAISPVPFAQGDFLAKVESQVVLPTLEGLKSQNIDFVGFIFIGLMNVEGNPYVIEYNVRMGDPEAEVVIPRIKSDLVELLDLTAQKRLSEATLEIDERTATTVMLVSGGYPENYEKGKEMTGFENLPSEIIPFHAGTKLENDKTLTAGGRVIALTALGKDIKEALEISYSGAEVIDFEGKYFRSDIGFDL